MERIVAIIDLIFGVGGLLSTAYFFFFVFGKVNEVYQEFGANINYTSIYGYFVLIILWSIITIFLGVKLFSTKNSGNNWYLTLGILLPALAIFILPPILALGTLMPMFNLVNVIK